MIKSEICRLQSLYQKIDSFMVNNDGGAPARYDAHLDNHLSTLNQQFDQNQPQTSMAPNHDFRQMMMHQQNARSLTYHD